MSKKKAYIDRDLHKLLQNKYRANELIKNPFKDGALLQLRLTLFKRYSVEFTKKITNVGSNYSILKNVRTVDS